MPDFKKYLSLPLFLSLHHQPHRSPFLEEESLTHTVGKQSDDVEPLDLQFE